MERLAVFDVIPILEGWATDRMRASLRPTDRGFCWCRGAAAGKLFARRTKAGHGVFGPENSRRIRLHLSRSGLRPWVFGEYLVAAMIDVEHDHADKEARKRIECPMLHPWVDGGPLDPSYGKDGGSLGIWRQ